MAKAVEGGRIFYQLLELGYEKFPHNITGHIWLGIPVMSISIVSEYSDDFTLWYKWKKEAISSRGCNS